MRVTPARRDSAAEDADAELLLHARDTGGMCREFSGLSAQIRDWLNQKDCSTSQDETWARLTEMAGLSLGGFGLFNARFGMGTYSREREATILRQFNTDKDDFRGGGLHFQIGIRIAHAAAPLARVALNPDKHDDDTVTSEDCIPRSYEEYDSFAPDGEKPAPRGKTPQTADMFVRSVKQKAAILPYFAGRGYP